MLPLGHLGIGSFLARPWRARTTFVALLLGTLLPDLIDKPLYYIPHFLTGESGAALGLISGTRTLGHSLLFLICLFIFSARNASPRRAFWLGLAIGVATHLFLDNIFDAFEPLTIYSSRIGLFFPYYGWRFPIAHHLSLTEHLRSHAVSVDLVGELVGAVLLWRLWRGQRAS